MKTLVIDDEFAVLRNIKNQFERNGWRVDIASTYEQAHEKIFDQQYDAIVCDYHLSDSDRSRNGLFLVEKMRESGIQTPVLFLTSRDVEPWEALDTGVDDFLSKPWKRRELDARIKALVRRTFRCDQNATNVIQHRDILLDIDVRKMQVGKRSVTLSHILFLLLKKFLQSPNQLLSYQDLIQYVWGGKYFAQNSQKNTLRVHIVHLKKLLGKRYAACIQTVHGEGYIWQEE